MAGPRKTRVKKNFSRRRDFEYDCCIIPNLPMYMPNFTLEFKKCSQCGETCDHDHIMDTARGTVEDVCSKCNYSVTRTTPLQVHE